MLCQRCFINPAEVKHHINYFPEETTGLCNKCHEFIHSWENPIESKNWIKYKQGDAQIFYQQQKRIGKILNYLSKKK